jgi:hypothetical protein
MIGGSASAWGAEPGAAAAVARDDIRPGDKYVADMCFMNGDSGDVRCKYISFRDDENPDDIASWLNERDAVDFFWASDPKPIADYHHAEYLREGWGAPMLFAVADGGAHPPTIACKALAKLKSDFDAHTRWTALSPGQFHFVEGVYVGSPSTPDGLPPGDGALLAQRDGDKDGVIVWTRGPLACAPITVGEKVIKMISSIKTGALDDDGGEL